MPTSSGSSILPGIDHIVVVMLENRGFDALLGWLYDGAQPKHFVPKGECLRFEGLYDAALPSLANPLTIAGSTTLYPPTKGAALNGIYLDSPPTDPHEEMQYVTDQIYGPLAQPSIDPPPGAKPDMKGFLQDYASLWSSPGPSDVPAIRKVLETYTPDQLPVLCGLARAFACSDMWFSSAPTQTNPNRAFMACGTSLGQINNEGFWNYGDFDTDTIWNRLDTKQVSWRIFWEEAYFPDKPGDTMSWTRTAFPRITKQPDSQFPNMAEFHRLARSGGLPAFSFIEPSFTLEKGGYGGQGSDYHPPGDLRPGEALLAQIYTSLLANAQAFQRTLLVITFDEHGGTYDHWTPGPAVPPDTNQKQFRFDRYGVRVPTIFVSPWIDDGTVIRATLPGQKAPPFDHTSIPATVLSWQGFTPGQYGLGQRTLQAPTFEAVLNRKSARSGPELLLGAPRTPSPRQSLRLFDKFYLRYSSGGAKSWYVGQSTSDFEGTYPTMTGDLTKRAILSFTLGTTALDVPNEIVTHGSFVYVTSLDAAVQSVPHWASEVEGSYIFDVWYSADTDATTPGSQLYWMVKLVAPELRVLGQSICYGDVVTLENRYTPNLGKWLPGLLVPDTEQTPYLTVTDDAGYADPKIGHWVIEPVG